MKPNWSKLEAAGRAAFLVFFGTFFGALTVASGGDAPVTWPALKPIVLTAFYCAAGAEILWIRSQLAAWAAALGLPVAATVTSAVLTSTLETTPAETPAAKALQKVDTVDSLRAELAALKAKTGQAGYSGVGTIAALAVVAVLVVLVTAACAGCTKAQVAQVQSVDTTAINLTNSVCALAPDSPVGQPYVEVVCAIAGGIEQLVYVVGGALAEADADGGTTTSVAVPLLSVRFRIPANTAPAFLASHKAH